MQSATIVPWPCAFKVCLFSAFDVCGNRSLVLFVDLHSNRNGFLSCWYASVVYRNSHQSLLLLYCTGDTHTFEIVRDAYPVTMKDGFWKSTLLPIKRRHTFLTNLQSGFTSSTDTFDLAGMGTIDYCAARWTEPCSLARCLYPKVFHS